MTEPTRAASLLDIALPSVPDFSSANMLPVISDHGTVLVRLDVPMPSIVTLDRTVWDFLRVPIGNHCSQVRRVSRRMMF